MSKSRSLRVTLIITAVLVFAAALMGVFVFGTTGVVANASGDLSLRANYYLNGLVINGVSEDPQDWAVDHILYNMNDVAGNANKIPVTVTDPETDIIASFEWRTSSNNTRTPVTSYGYAGFSAGQACIFTPEGGPYMKMWALSSDEPESFSSLRTDNKGNPDPFLIGIPFEVTSTVIVNSYRIKFDGNSVFGEDYQQGEMDYYGQGETIADRLVFENAEDFKDDNNIVPAINGAGISWAAGTHWEDGDATWSQNWITFNATATAGCVFTLKVPVTGNNEHSPVDVYVPFTVAKARLCVRPTQSFTYDGNPHAPSTSSLQLYKYAVGDNYLWNISASNVINNDTASAVNAGSYPLSCTVKSTYADDYKLKIDEDAYEAFESRFYINRRTVTIVWSGDNGAAYDGTQKSVTATISNKCGNDDVTLAVGGVYNATASGNYTANATGLNGAAKANYNFTNATNKSYSWTINQVPLTLTWSADSLTYSGAEQSVTATITGGVIGSDVVNVASYSGNAATAAGDYTATATLGGADGGNYYIAEASSSHSWSILKKALTVTADNKTVRYGSEAPEYTYSYSGFATGEDQSVFTGGSVSVSCAYNTAQPANRGVGEYDIVPTGTLTAANYDISYVAGTLTCFIKQLIVKPEGSIWLITYGDPLPEFSYSISGFEYDDDESLLDGTAVITCSYDPSDKAKRSANYNGYSHISGSNYYWVNVGGLTVTSANYYIYYDSKHLDVDRKVISFTWGDLHPVYDKTEKTVTATPVLVYAGDDVYVTSYEGNKATNYNIYGDFTYTATITGIGGEDASNYYLSDNSPNKSTKWAVEQRPIQLDITIGSVQMSYNEGYYPNQNVEFTPDVVYAAMTQMPSIQISNIIPGDPVGTCTFVEISGVNNPTNRPISADTPWGVGRYCAKYSFLEDSDNWDRINYDVPHFIYLYYDITPAPLTLTWSGDNGATYDGTQKTVTATITGGVLGSDYVDIVEYTNNQKTDVGTYVATASVYDESSMGYNYYIADGYEWSIVARTLTVTANNKTITYGDAPANDGVTYTGFADGEDESVLTGTLSFAYTYAQYGTVGNYTITPSGLTAENYTIAYHTGTLSVEQFSLQLEWQGMEDFTAVYNGQEQAVVTGAIINALNNDNVSVTLSGNSKKDVGGYFATASLTGNKKRNYRIAYPYRTFTITPCTMTYTITIGDVTMTNEEWAAYRADSSNPRGKFSGEICFPASFVYNGATQRPVITLTNVCSGDTLSPEGSISRFGSSSGWVSAGAGTKVGTHSFTFGVDNDNYRFANGATTQNVKYEIDRAPLTITFSNLVQTYSGSNLDPTGVIDPEGVADVDKTPGGEVDPEKLYISYRQTINAGAYTPSGGTNKTKEFSLHGESYVNYCVAVPENASFAYVPGTYAGWLLSFTILPRTLTFSWTGLSAADAVYSGAVKTVTAAITGGVVDGETITIASYSNNSKTNVGEYTAAVAGLSGSTASNYTLEGSTNVTFDWSITKAALTVTADDKTITYGNVAPTYTATITGFVGLENEANLRQNNKLSGGASVTCAYQAGNNVGTYTITAAENDLEATNYDFVYETGTLTVDPANLTVTSVLQDGVLTYSTAAQTPEVIATVTAVNDQAITYLYSKTEGSGYVALDQISYTDVADAGALYYKFTAPNHNDATGEITITMNRAILTITADDKAVTYGDAAPEYTVSYSGFLPGEGVEVLTGELAVACEYAQYDNVGAYDITPSGLTAANYDVTFVPGTLNVGKKSATVTADDKAVTFGEAAPEYTVTITGLVNGDTLGGEIAYACSYAQNGAAGTYDITPSGLTSDNYAITFVKGTLTVGKASVTLTVSVTGWTYGGDVNAPSVSGNSGNGVVTYQYKLTEADDTTYTSDVPADAGAYTVRATVAETANYLGGTATGTFTVAKATVTLTVSVENWSYGESANAPVVSGNLGGGEETVEYKLTSAEDGDYTTAVPTEVGAYTVRYTVGETSNYLGGSATDTFEIVSATLTLTVSIEDWTYGDAANAPVVSGNVGGGAETIEYKLAAAADDTYTTTVPSDAGAYTVRATVTETANYLGGTATGTFTIAKADYDMSGVTFESASVTYDGAAHGLTVGGTLPTGIDGIQVTVACSGSALNVLDGAVTVTATFATESANYNVPEAMTATITVLAKELTVVWDLPQGGFVYDGTEQDVQIASVNTGVANETLALTVTASSSFKDAGSNYVLTAQKSEANDNYTLAGAVLENVSIQPRPITVSYISTQKAVTYGNTVEWNALGAEMTANGMYLTTDDEVANGEGLLTIVACRFDDEDGVQYDMSSLGDTVPAGTYTMVVVCNDYNFNVTTADGFADNAKLIVNKAVITVVPMEGQNCTYGSASTLTYDAYLPTYEQSGEEYQLVNVNIAEMLEGLGAGWTLADFVTGALGIEGGSGNSYLITLGTLALADGAGITDDDLRMEVESVYANYELALSATPVYVTISKAQLTVRAKDRTVKYGESLPALANDTVSVEYIGFVGGDTKAVLDGSLTFSCGYGVTSTAGTNYAINLGGLTSDKYEITFVPGTLTVQKRTINITNTNTSAFNYVYGDASVYALNIASVLSISGDGFASGDSFASVAVVTLAVGADKATASPILQQLSGSNFGFAATYWLYALSKNANYQVVGAFDDNAKLVISKKSLTFTAADVSVPYGNEAPAFSVTTEDFAYDDAQKDRSVVFSGTLVFECAYNAGDAVGNTYDITPSGVTAGNYNVSFASGTLTVVKKTLTVTAKDKAITYGDAPANDGVTYSGFIDGDDESDLTGTVTFSYDYDQYDDAGSYRIIPGGVSSDNYEINFVDGVLTVSKKALTVTAVDKTVTYGDAPANAGVSCIGFADGDDEDDLNGSLTFSYNYQQYGNVGTYAITPLGWTSVNYEIEFVPGTLTVQRKDLTVTAKDKTIPYGDPAANDGVTYSGFTGADTAANALGGTLVFGYNYNRYDAIGTYDITPSGLTATNYNVNYVDGVLTVVRRQVTILNTNTSPLSYVYGDASVYALDPSAYIGIGGDGLAENDTFASIATLTLAVGAERATASPILSALNGTNFGYAATYWMYIIPRANDNYVVSIGFDDNAKLIISPKALTVTADDKTVKYGDEAPEFTVTYEGFVTTVTLGGHDFNYNDGPQKFTGELVLTCDYQAGAEVGTYAITPSGVSNGNYAITFVPGVLTVQKRVITVGNTNAEPYSYVYGDASVYTLNIASILSFGGDALASGDQYGSVVLVTLAVGADKATASPILQPLSGSNFGYAATYWLYSVALNDNYDVEDAFDDNAKLVITKKALTVTAENKTVVYGEEAPAFTVAYDGFVGGNYNDSEAKLTGALTFECAFNAEDPQSRGVGSYVITPGGVSSGNYAVTFVPGTLTVQAREVTLAWGEEAFVYDQTEQAPSVTVGNLAYDDEVVVTVTGKGVNAGEYTATAAELSDGNYVLPTECDKAFVIAKKAATVTADDKQSDLFKEIATLTATTTGILEGDEVYTLSTTADKTVEGTYPIVVTLTGNENYEVTATDGTYTVNSNVVVVTDPEGNTTVTGKEKINPDEASEKGVNITNLIKRAIDAAAEAPVANLSVEIGNGATVTFDKAALAELAKADDIVITYRERSPRNIDKSEKALKKAELVIEVSLGDVTFEGGKATVSTAFDNKSPLGKKAVVYYVDENGDKTDMEATFRDGYVTFTTGHFSTYAVEYVWKTGAIVANVVAGIVGLAVIILLILLIVKKVKSKKNGPDPYEAARDEAEQDPEEAGEESYEYEEQPEYEEAEYDEEAEAYEEEPEGDEIEYEEAEEPEEEVPELTLSESLANARDLGAAGLVTKDMIAQHLVDTFGDKVELNCRENRTPNGKLLLSDNHFAFTPDGKRVCFSYIYQDDDGDVIILLRTTAEHAHEIRQAHKSTGLKSAFPKNKQRDWYSVIVDDTFTEEDVYAVLDQAVLNITGQEE